MEYDYIFRTKFADDQKKNGMHCRILRTRTNGVVPRFDVEFEDGTRMKGVYEAELQETANAPDAENLRV